MWTIIAHNTGIPHDEPMSPLIGVGIAMLLVAGIVVLRYFGPRDK